MDRKLALKIYKARECEMVSLKAEIDILKQAILDDANKELGVGEIIASLTKEKFKEMVNGMMKHAQIQEISVGEKLICGRYRNNKLFKFNLRGVEFEIEIVLGEDSIEALSRDDFGKNNIWVYSHSSSCSWIGCFDYLSDLAEQIDNYFEI